MKKFIWFFAGLLTVAASFGAFQSGIITGTEFCLWTVCVSDWSLFSRSLPGRITVSSNSTFTGIKQAIDRINVNAAHPYEVLIDAGNRDITDTITVNASYPITIRWLWFSVTTLQASWWLANKPMFDIQSEIEISNLNIDGTLLAWYGTNIWEDWFSVTANNWDFCQFDNVGIYGFNRGINLLANAELRVFNSTLEDNVAYGTYISWWNYRSAETDYNNSAVGIYLYAGSGKFLSTEHDSYIVNSWQIAILYSPTSYVNYSNISIFNDNFIKSVGIVVLSGFDFTLQRDANIELYWNIWIENHRPHAKINVVGGVITQSLSAATWTKVSYTLTDSFTQKRWITTTGRITFLSDNRTSVQMWISATVSSTTTPTDLQFAIVKNGSLSTKYGIMNVYLDSSGRAFNFSQNIYLDDVGKDDYFELAMYAAWGGESVTLKNLNRYIDSR